MKCLSLFLLYLLFPLVTLASDVSGQSRKFYAYDESNSATLIVESKEGIESLSYFIKVDQTCYEESVKTVKIKSKSLNTNLTFIYNCYGDLYDLEPADNLELNQFIEYINSHTDVDVGSFEFKLKDYSRWIQNFDKPALIDTPTLGDHENLDSFYSQGWRDAEKQLNSKVYLDGWDDGQKQLSDKKYVEGVNDGRAIISSEKNLILTMLIFSLFINFYIYFKKKKKENLGSTPKSKENNADSEKRIAQLVNKLDTANATIKKANERIYQLKTVSDQKANSEEKTLVLEKKIETLSRSVQKLKKENSNLTININNIKKSNFNITPYSLLGVSPSKFDFSRAKSNYKKLSQIYHPDKSGSQEMMKKLNDAYDQLKIRI